MPEYRRFIAYFYEYINGKKQKNAGFAKVELRNGMWRILFRLTCQVLPAPPLQVFGFVRVPGHLLGIRMGTMDAGGQISEEWAYEADRPLGESPYSLEELAGIWVQSGDGRIFLTVWDDEAVDPDTFVLQLPEKKQRKIPDTAEETSEQASDQKSDQAADKSVPEKIEVTDSDEPQAEVPESGMDEMQAEAPAEGMDEISIQSEVSVENMSATKAEVIVEGMEEITKPASAERSEEIENLFRKRTHFQPFPDHEITNCVMIMPCDIVRLQQEKWLVGRSSFLQHGFYQHRHLLLGTTGDGRYVLGVPGIRNPQEKYMAELFGFGRFKLSGSRGCSLPFGYWWRILQKEDQTQTASSLSKRTPAFASGEH